MKKLIRCLVAFVALVIIVTIKLNVTTVLGLVLGATIPTVLCVIVIKVLDGIVE